MESNEMFPEEDCDKMKAHLDGVMVESVNYGWDMAMDNPTPVEDQEISMIYWQRPKNLG